MGKLPEGDITITEYFPDDPVVSEDPVEDSLPLEDVENTEPVQISFNIIESGTTKGKDLLNSSDGFCYSLSKEVGNKKYWRCTHRNSGRNERCPATVVVSNDYVNVKIGTKAHTHVGNKFEAPKRLLFRNAMPDSVTCTSRLILFQSNICPPQSIIFNQVPYFQLLLVFRRQSTGTEVTPGQWTLLI